MDEEELGGITFDYFIKSLDIDRVKKEKKDTIRRVYRKYDKKNKGFIQYEDLRHVAYKELQEDIDEDVL
jgi:Ca2+-binding EF-hand superfamily protein